MLGLLKQYNFKKAKAPINLLKLELKLEPLK